MGHGPFVRGIIQFAKVVARYCFGNDSQMQSGTDSGEEKVVWVEPGQSRRIVEEKMRVATQYRDGVGCKSGILQNRVGDLRAVW